MAHTDPNPILLTPLKPALIEASAQRLTVLVRVQAPDAEPGTIRARKPYHLALAIDRSGSMSGPPLREAIRCARHIVDRVAPTDRVALVAFDDRVKTLVEASRAGDRTALHRALAGLRSGGCTNLHGGWRQGADLLAPAATEAALSRVILLSDGNANTGETNDATEIANQCAERAALGVSTSTYGLGRDFNEDLMVAMARLGQGNHYYGQTAADLFEPFAEEFDLIANLYARNLRLHFGGRTGSRIRVLNDYVVEARDRDFPAVRLPDLPWGAEAWVLVEVDIPAEAAGDAAVPVLQVGASAVSAEGTPIAFRDATLTLPSVPPSAWDVLLPDELAAQRLAEVEAGRLLDRAREAAQMGNWGAVEATLQEAQRRFGEHEWLIAVLEEMATIAREADAVRFSKEALYASGKLNRRLSAKDELRWSMMDDRQKASYLRRKPSQGKAQFDDPDEDRS